MASLSMLAAAHGFERFGNMPPCALCLHQREAYWGALSIAMLALIVDRFRPNILGTRALTLLLACAFGAGALIAGFHVGVEYKWWPGLAECAAGGKMDMSGDLLGALSKSMEVPACDKVAWSMLGISMAGWNMLISLGLAAASLLATLYPDGFGGHQND
jgi:disulfide bond formation protein DsbB